jgi:hypothetical protein
LREIEPQRLRQRIDLSSARGLAQVAELVRILPDKTPEWTRVQLDKAMARAQSLRRWRTPGTEADVLDSSELADLKRAIERLRGLSSDQGPDLAQIYLTFFASQPQAPEPANAGIGMVQELRAALDERLRNAIRDDYLRRLKDKLAEGRFDPLRQALAWKPGESAVFDQDDHLVEQLDRLLKEGGEFDLLKREFRLTGAERPLEPILFPPPAAEQACEPSATLHHFLASLQKFLLEDGSQRNKSVRQAKLRFTLQPVTEGDPQSLWLAKGDEARGFLYFPDSRSPALLQKLLIGVDKGAGKVDEWGFTDPPRERKLLLVWSNKSNQDDARNDTGRFEYAVPSSLAPLLLAWQADSNEGCQTFDLLLKPIFGTARSARLRLQFERAVPLPPAAPW